MKLQCLRAWKTNILYSIKQFISDFTKISILIIFNIQCVPIKIFLMINRLYKSHRCRSYFTSPRGYVMSRIYIISLDRRSYCRVSKGIEIEEIRRGITIMPLEIQLPSVSRASAAEKKQRLPENEERAGVEFSRSYDSGGWRIWPEHFWCIDSISLKSSLLPSISSDVLPCDPLSIFREWGDNPLNNKIESWIAKGGSPSLWSWIFYICDITLHRSTFQNLHHHEIKLIKYYFTDVNTKDFEIFWYT